MFIGEGKFESLLSKINEEILLEKRRGGYTDPSIVDQLEKYKEGKYFISFSNNLSSRPYGYGERDYYPRDYNVKLGINPKNPYKTPTGIYSYPVWAMWNKIFSNDIPYASTRRNIFVFRPKNNERVAYASTYTYERMAEDCRKLFNISPNYPPSEDLKRKYDKFFIAHSHYPIHPLTFIWNMARTVSERNVNRWALSLYKLYDGIVDDLGLGIIHPSEPTQGVFFNSKSIKVIDLIKNPQRKSSWGGNRNITIRSREELEMFIKSEARYFSNVDILNVNAPDLNIHNKIRILSLTISNCKFNSLDLVSRNLKIRQSSIGEVNVENTMYITIEGNTTINNIKNPEFLKEITLKNTKFNPFIHGLNDNNIVIIVNLDNWRGSTDHIPPSYVIVDTNMQI